jgi:hypothetical protein
MSIKKQSIKIIKHPFYLSHMWKIENEFGEQCIILTEKEELAYKLGQMVTK